MAKKAESTLKNMLLALALIAFFASLALALVNNVTKGPIEKVNQEKVANAIRNVLPPFESYSIDTVEVNTTKGMVNMTRYTAVDNEGNLIGKAIESWDDNGFGGRLTAMVGFDKSGNISGYEILASSETPGLGAKADKWFQKDNRGDVIGKNPATEQMTVKKDGGSVDAITGSTITSRAFCRLIATAFNAFNTEKGESK